MEPLPLRGIGSYSINSAVAAVPVGVGIGVSGAFVEPIGDIHRTIRRQREVAGGEPGVVGHEQLAAIAGLEGGAPRFEGVPLDGMTEQIAGDVFAMKLWRK